MQPVGAGGMPCTVIVPREVTLIFSLTAGE